MAKNKGFNAAESCHQSHPSLVTRHGQHVQCPKCGSRGAYQLADGRRQCKRCRAKYTPKRPQNRLDDATLWEIARLFWLMVPAVRVANDLGLNRKTVQRHYRRMREHIAQASEQALGLLAGEIEVDESYFGGARKGKRGRGAGGKIPVFGLLKRDGIVRVVFPKRVDKANLQGAIKAHVRPHSWVYSDSYRAYDQLDLEGFRHVRICHRDSFGAGRVHINGIENFWGFAKRRLKMYHGGFKRNFPLFMREMEFRFNHRNDPEVVDYLYILIKAGPV